MRMVTDLVWTPAGPASVFLIDDMPNDQRWPEYAKSVAHHGMLSSLLCSSHRTGPADRLTG